MEGILKKMGDPKRLTLPCEFGNNTKTFALADSGVSINLMPYCFYQKLNLLELKTTRMTIHMTNHSVTNPQGIIEDILVKVGKFIFPVDIVMIDMKRMKMYLLSLGTLYLIPREPW